MRHGRVITWVNSRLAPMPERRWPLMCCDTGGAQKCLLSSHVTPPKETEPGRTHVCREAAAITWSAWETRFSDSIARESSGSGRYSTLAPVGSCTAHTWWKTFYCILSHDEASVNKLLNSRFLYLSVTVTWRIILQNVWPKNYHRV